MKDTKRILGLALSGLLVVGTLTGCANGNGKTVSASPTPTLEGAVAEVTTPDVVQKLLGFPRDTVLFTVNGQPVLAEDYLYCLSYATEDMGQTNYGSVTKIDWTAEQGGTTIKQYLMDSAMESAKFYRILGDKAAEKGISITAEDQKALNQQLSDMIDQMGGREEYALRLQEVALSDAGFRRLNETNTLYTNLQEKMFGAKGAQPATEQELIDFGEANGRLLAKHILIKTVDDANAPLAEEAQAAAKAKAEDLLAQLKAATPADQAALFDKLMNENSEDGRTADGKLAAPDGYLFGDGDMDPAFEAGTKALEYNQISDLVETVYGYHIILRLPPVNEDVRQAWPAKKMSDQMDQWIKEAKVETKEEFDKLDPQAYYEKLTALRAELAPTPTPAPTESGTPTPTPSGAQ